MSYYLVCISKKTFRVYEGTTKSLPMNDSEPNKFKELKVMYSLLQNDTEKETR